MEAHQLPKIEAPIHVDRDSDELKTFVEKSMTLIESVLESNHKDAQAFTDVDKSVDDVLDNDNIRSVEVRARPLENPKVTLWLKDCPTWANHAWRETFHPFGMSSFNGKTTVSFDVRPF